MTDATIHDITLALPPTIMALAALIQGLRNGNKADKIITQGNGHTTMLTEALKKSTSDAADVAAKASDGQAALIDKLIPGGGGIGDRVGDAPPTPPSHPPHPFNGKTK